MAELARAIGARMEPVLIPWDCADGFFEAYWRRPEAYLDDQVRRGVSVWARVGPQAEQRAVRSLPEDLVSGPWAERNRDLVALDAAELGLRLLVSEQHPYARIRDPGIGEALSHSPNQPPVPAADKARQLCWGSGDMHYLQPRRGCLPDGGGATGVPADSCPQACCTYRSRLAPGARRRSRGGEAS